MAEEDAKKVEEEKKEEPDTGLANDEDGFDAAWEEDTGDGTPSKDAEAGTAEDKTDAEPDETDDPKAPKDSPKPEEHDYEKRFKDTQSALTKTQQENADMSKRLKTLEEKGSEDDDGKKADPPESLKELEQDDPELLAAIKYTAEQIAGDSETDGKLKEEVSELREELGQARFNAAVIGGYVDPESKKYIAGHHDAFEVMATDQFEKFYNEEKSKDPALQEEHMHPSTAISLINRFKEVVAKQGASDHDQELSDKKKEADDKLSSGVDDTQGSKTTPQASGQDFAGQEAEFDAEFDNIDIPTT